MIVSAHLSRKFPIQFILNTEFVHILVISQVYPLQVTSIGITLLLSDNLSLMMSLIEIDNSYRD